MAKVLEPKLYIKYIQDSKSDIISSITFDEKTGKGKITYNPKCVNVDPEAPDFKGTTTNLNDEEMVRAVLLLKLEKEYGYKFENKYIDIEKGDKYWISGLKKEESNRHWAGHGKIMVDRRAVNEYLSLIGEKELPLNLFEVVDIEDRFPVKRVKELLNEKK